jgi:hypothetical protein
MLSVISSSNSNGCTHQSYLITTVVYEADLSWPFLLSPHPNKKKKKSRPKHPTPQHKLRNLVCNIKSNRYTIGLSDNYQIPFCSPNSDHAKFFTNGNHKSIFFFLFSFFIYLQLWDEDLVRQISSIPAVQRVVALGTLCALELRAEGCNAGYCLISFSELFLSVIFYQLSF